ncbi:hypothetical protein EXIGLDRAFT_841863 [Exidia glandulosa HHB12029]|uniref:RING-type domain-containing protein n=1 Tax=Exidia glandulosa HHB12029 TaxID=1314781 RepID=A0A165DMG4_EXIGL|nr:hypothetical protein EXIGLDRAFT_841863 [Exidia glandulosa HHB12029]
MPSTLRASRQSKPASAATSQDQAQAGSSKSRSRSRSGKRSAASAHSDAEADNDKPSSRKRQKRQADDGELSVASTISSTATDKQQEELELVVVRQPRAPRRARRNRARKSNAGAGSSRTTSSVSTPASRVDRDDDEEDRPHDETPKAKTKNGAKSPLAKDFAPHLPQLQIYNAVPVKPEVEETAVGDVSPGVASMEAEILTLKRLLSEKEQVIDRQHSALSAVHTTLQCQVCLELLTRPFVMSKCGHVCCQECLESWFTHAPQGDMALMDDGAERPLHARRKTCPHCRERVTTAPTPIYLVKNLVSIMNVPNILDKTSPRAATREPSVLPGAADDGNPFAKFFAPDRQHNMPFFDHEDGGIMRCESCFHEVWDGQCTVCGRVYDFDADGNEWDDEGSVDGLDDHELDPSDDEDDDSEGSLDGFIEHEGVIAPPFNILAHLFGSIQDLDNEDDEDEEELDHLGLMAHPVVEVHEISSSDEEGGPHIDEYNSALEDAEMSDEEDAVVTAPRRLNSRIIYDDSEEEDDLEIGHESVTDDQDDSLRDAASLQSQLSEEEYWSDDGRSHGGSDEEW